MGKEELPPCPYGSYGRGPGWIQSALRKRFTGRIQSSYSTFEIKPTRNKFGITVMDECTYTALHKINVPVDWSSRAHDLKSQLHEFELCANYITYLSYSTKTVCSIFVMQAVFIWPILSLHTITSQRNFSLEASIHFSINSFFFRESVDS